MIRIALLATVLLAGCTDSPTSPAGRSDATVSGSASTSAKPPLKEPDPEIR
jgi:hypothetical protein